MKKSYLSFTTTLFLLAFVCNPSDANQPETSCDKLLLRTRNSRQVDANAALMRRYNNLPEGVVGEIINGKLYTHSKATPRHDTVVEKFNLFLHDVYGLNGRGSCFIRREPPLELRSTPKQVIPDRPEPDIAGWSLEHRSVSSLLNQSETKWKIAPDWICQVISRGTKTKDYGVKMSLYAKYKVRYYWIFDPRPKFQTLEVFILDNDGKYGPPRFFGQNKNWVRAEPFNDIEFDLNSLWGHINRIESR
jgi:Uma2 family endonuclease